MTYVEPIGAHKPWFTRPAAALIRSMLDVPELPCAACVGQHQLFDLAGGNLDGSSTGMREAERQALACCASCGALGQCAAWLASLSVEQRPTGVIAGTVVSAKPGAGVVRPRTASKPARRTGFYPTGQRRGAGGDQST